MIKGGRVRLTVDGRTVDAELVLVSPNLRSLFLTFDAILGGHVGGMALYKETDADPYRSLHSGQIATVEEA